MHEITGSAAHHQDAHVRVLRKVTQVVGAVVRGERGVAFFDILRRLPVGVEWLEPRSEPARRSRRSSDGRHGFAAGHGVHGSFIQAKNKWHIKRMRGPELARRMLLLCARGPMTATGHSCKSCSQTTS